MTALLDADVDVNAVDDEGDTALHQVASSSHYLSKPAALAAQAARWLLERGAQVNAINHHGSSPLVLGPHQAVREVLMAHGGRVVWPGYALEYDLPQQQLNAISYHDHGRFDELLAQVPPRLLARAVGEGNHHALDRLWHSGDHAPMVIDQVPGPALLAESITQQEGMNVAMLRDLVPRSQPEALPPRDADWLRAANSCLRHFVSPILDQPVEMVELLLALGLPAEPPADAQHSPLSSAIDAKSAAKVALLLAHGANPNRLAYHGGNALHEAVECKATDCIPLLLQVGADRTHCDRLGRTPLPLAVAKRNKTAQKLLSA